MQLIPWKHRNGVRPSAHSSHPLDTQFDALVQQFFSGPFVGEAWTNAGSLATAMDVSESADEVVVRADLPGVPSDALEITFNEGVLTIQGEKRDEQRSDKQGWRVSERRFGSFKRSFAIPTPIDEAKIAAEHKDGVLTVRLPKVAPPQARKIEIRPS